MCIHGWLMHRAACLLREAILASASYVLRMEYGTQGSGCAPSREGKECSVLKTCPCSQRCRQAARALLA